jgi:DNA adenine methylase
MFQSINGSIVNREAANVTEAQSSRESYYFWIRSQFNALSKEARASVVGSAMLLFLNKTCFRGVYREGPRGFNVPYGNYKNPSILDEDHIRSVSELIKDVVFVQRSFEDSLMGVAAGDFVYLDPPYAPESETSFVSYTADGFTLEQHKMLFAMCAALHTKGARLVMSNADVKLVKNAFPSPPFTTRVIVCRRAINSKNPESKTNEVLIHN